MFRCLGVRDNLSYIYSLTCCEKTNLLACLFNILGLYSRNGGNGVMVMEAMYFLRYSFHTREMSLRTLP